MPWVLVSWMGWHSIVHCQLIQCSSLLLLPLASFPHCWIFRAVILLCLLSTNSTSSYTSSNDSVLLRKFSFSHVTGGRHCSHQHQCRDVFPRRWTVLSHLPWASLANKCQLQLASVVCASSGTHTDRGEGVTQCRSGRQVCNISTFLLL